MRQLHHPALHHSIPLFPSPFFLLIERNDGVVCFHFVRRQLHRFRRDDILGALIIHFGYHGAIVAMKAHCNTICVLKSAPPLITSKMSFARLQLKQQYFWMLNLVLQVSLLSSCK